MVPLARNWPLGLRDASKGRADEHLPQHIDRELKGMAHGFIEIKGHA